MAQAKRFPYQTMALLPKELGEWIDRVHDEDGVTKAHAVRMAFREGRAHMERSGDLDALLVEDAYQHGVARFTYPYPPRLSQEDGDWIDGLSESKGVDKSLIIRVALQLGMKVVEKRRRAAQRVAT